MLNHENIEIELNKDAKEDLSFDMQTHQVYYQGQLWQGKIIFTGAIDDFFDHCLGRLPYRSLRFEYEHYPEDHYQSHGVVNYTCLLYTSQSGQYNYARCMQREDEVAATLALNEFIDQTLSLLYLLNKKYKPYYKWSYYGLKDCTCLQAVTPLLLQLVQLPSQKQHWPCLLYTSNITN